MEVLGLQGSVVGIISKSEETSQVSSDDPAPSSIGVTLRFILHSDCSGSQLYSKRVVSSFQSK